MNVKELKKLIKDLDDCGSVIYYEDMEEEEAKERKKDSEMRGVLCLR